MDFFLVKSGGMTGLAILLALIIYKLLEVFVFNRLKQNSIDDYKLKKVILTTLTNDLEFNRMVDILVEIDKLLRSLNNTVSDIKNLVEKSVKGIEELSNKIDNKFGELKKRLDTDFDELKKLLK